MTFVVLALCGAAAGLLAPYPPDGIDLDNVNLAPTLRGGHILGTDPLGRDHLSRLLFALRTTIVVASIAAGLSAAVGVGVGALSGYAGGLIDAVAMRLTDLVLTLPALAVALAAAEFAGARGAAGVGVVIALLLWPRLARAVRAAVVSMKQEEFVQAARALGASSFRITIRHMLPNTSGLVVVHIALAFAVGILAEATLSFLGFGIQPPVPSLGGLIRDSRATTLDSWWLLTFPGMTLMLLTMTVGFAGDAFRESLEDPQGLPR